MSTQACAEPLASCFDAAGARYRIDPVLLKAIAKVESNFKVGAINRANRDGSVDVGIMQINSRWFSKLQTFGISQNDLVTNGCTNIHVGAWILAGNFQAGGVTWEAVGAYNAGFGKHSRAAAARQVYIAKIKHALRGTVNDRSK